MASCCKLTKDPSGKWFIYMDWSDWVGGIIADIGGTVDITNSQWFLDTGLVEEAGTPTVDTNYKTFLYGSGGTDGQTYSVMNRITYDPSALTPSDFTEDRTITIKIQEK